jgi:hypothetical protein
MFKWLFRFFGGIDDAAIGAFEYGKHVIQYEVLPEDGSVRLFLGNIEEFVDSLTPESIAAGVQTIAAKKAQYEATGVAIKRAIEDTRRILGQ